jgi:acetyl-CoA carboxylase biotin carboxyl carrier protein
MDLKEIKSIIDLMKRSELTEFEIEEQNFKLRIRRDSNQCAYNPAGTPPPYVVEQAPRHPGAYAPAPTNHTQAPAAESKASDANISIIKSPMVGTFYKSSSPEAAPFAPVGSTVRPDSVVCIIEAMKVMNEIHAEIAGTIVEVLVDNGQVVEYGQPLFKVRK